MPKSKVRKKPETSVPRSSGVASSAAARAVAPSPSWYPIVMALIMVIGLAYLVVYYLTESWWALTPTFDFLAELTYWNLVIGFSAMVAALILLTKWR